MRTQRFLRRTAASIYLDQTYGLHRAPATLAKLAVIGGGPEFQRIGRVPFYSPESLDEWVASKLSAPMRSTSDMASPKTKTNECSSQPDADRDDGAGDRSSERGRHLQAS
jgi:hypothetical protein